MASNERIGWALSVLKHLPSNNPVTAETITFYAIGLSDLTDAEVTTAVGHAAKRCKFLPTPAELIGFLPKPAPPDAERLLSQIQGLSDYHPARGTTPPRVEAVTAILGDAAGEAYGMAGGGLRLFSGNDTTASIARRDFVQALTEALKAGRTLEVAPVLALPSRDSGAIVYDDRPRVGSGPRRLGAGNALADALDRVPR